MNSAIERLLALRTSDVMSKKIVAVSVDETLGSAAQKLLQHSISGVPVIDAQQRCAGVLTALDFVKAFDRQNRSHQAIQSHDDIRDTVGGHMTPVVHSIVATESLLNAARMMCLHHIHRLVILDAERRPIGVVTSLDVVSAMVKAIEE